MATVIIAAGRNWTIDYNAGQACDVVIKVFTCIKTAWNRVRNMFAMVLTTIKTIWRPGLMKSSKYCTGEQYIYTAISFVVIQWSFSNIDLEIEKTHPPYSWCRRKREYENGSVKSYKSTWKLGQRRHFNSNTLQNSGFLLTLTVAGEIWKVAGKDKRAKIFSSLEAENKMF